MAPGRSASSWTARIACGALAAHLALALACAEPSTGDGSATTGSAGSGTGSAAAQASGAAAETRVAGSSSPAPAPRTEARATLLAGGDVSFGQLRGQELLRDPARNDFAPLVPLLAAADVRFVNLESQLSEQSGETVSPSNPLVFTGPPTGAPVLARAGIDLVSLANNHAWDYGERAFEETAANLARAGVLTVGAGPTREQAYAPRILERGGLRIGFLAVTDIWNQGPLGAHPAREHVAAAEDEGLLGAVRAAKARPDLDVLVVSFHGGDEYVDTPREGVRQLLRAMVAAGADVVVGHHPHVVQRVEIVDGKPIFYSLGNLLMRMASGRPWTEFGLLARIELGRGKVHGIALCPVRIQGLDAVPLAADPARSSIEPFFRTSFERLLSAGKRIDPASAAELGPFEADGCAHLSGVAGPPASDAPGPSSTAPQPNAGSEASSGPNGPGNSASAAGSGGAAGAEGSCPPCRRIERCDQRAAQCVPSCPAGEIYVPATGPKGFVMGANVSAKTDTPHGVVLTQPFCMDATEVTVRAYQECVDAGRCEKPRGIGLWQTYPTEPDFPVNKVHWKQAKTYCEQRGQSLPTEAQWEWAATGGDGRKWPWGNEPPDCARADYTPSLLPTPSGDAGCHGGGPSAVGSHPAGDKIWPAGAIHDLAGNLWEWCLDNYLPYSGRDEVDPLHLDTELGVHVVRGGGWNRSARGILAAFRGGAVFSYQVPGLGFRCVRNAG